MPYTVHRQCACGRKYSHLNTAPDPGRCPVCGDEWAGVEFDDSDTPLFPGEERPWKPYTDFSDQGASGR